MAKQSQSFPAYLVSEIGRTLRGRNPWEQGPIALAFARMAQFLESALGVFWQSISLHQRVLGWAFAILLLAAGVAASLWATMAVLSEPKTPLVTLTATVPQPASPAAEGEKLLLEVSNLLQQDKHIEARDKIEKLHTLLPNDARTWQMDGAAMVASQDFSGARKALQRSVDLNPNAEIHLFNRAEIEFLAGNYAEAGHLFRMARATFPKGEKFLFRLYLCAILQGDDAEAASLLDSLPANAHSPDWHYIMAAKALHEGDKFQAHKLIDAARLLYQDGADDYEKTLRQAGLFQES